ncbi:MAG: PKD domain-containing protein [Bacteroidota bacterium]
MKHLLTPIVLLLNFVLFSQDYHPFSDGDVYHYSRTAGDKDYLFSVKLNFDMADLGDSVFNNYEQVNVLPSMLPDFDLNGQCIGTDSWIGRRAVKTSGGMVDFITGSDLPIHIKKDAVLNESWNLYQYMSNQHFIATVTHIYEGNVLGTADSIKEITLELFNEDNNNIMPHAFNGKKILLSKNNGFIQVYNFFNFPYETAAFTLIGNATQGEHPLAKENLYQFEVGDYLVHTTNSNNHDFRIITSKSVAADSYTYHCKKLTRTSNNMYIYNGDEVLVFAFSPGDYRMMGQFDNTTADYFNPYNGVTINYKKDNKAYIESLFFQDFSNPCWYWNSSYGSERTNLYVEGLGFLEQDYYEWYEDYDEWGNWVTQTFSTSYDLSYYDGSVEFGTYRHPYLQAMVGSDKTESCDGFITFSLPDAGMDSVLWHFGDGEESSLINPGHSYTSAGSYTVSVDLYSDYGDTTLLLINEITVGSNNSDHVTNPVKALNSSCNTFTFTDQTEIVTSRTWTFPGGETFTDSLVNFTFADTGAYVIYLENAHGYCSDEDSIELIIRTLENPIAASCPIQSPSYSLFGFDLDDVALAGSDYYYAIEESQAYDGFMNGCNQFELQAGDEVNLRLYVGYYELIDVGNGNYDPWYTGYQFDVWIDYNNSGDFDVSEQVASSFCGSDYDIGSNNIYGYGLFTVPLNAVRNQPLRMRLGANSENNPCEGELYDFSVFISSPLGTKEQQAIGQASIFPNPGKGQFRIDFNNGTAISAMELIVTDLSGKIVLEANERGLAANASKEFSLEHAGSGVYFVKTRLDNGAGQTIKLVKE